MSEHQGSRRVGPAVIHTRKGFLVLPIGWFIFAAVGTLIEFGFMIYSWIPKCLNGFCGHGNGGAF